MNDSYSLLTLWHPFSGPAWPMAFGLLLAHLAGDFVFQSDAMARNKRDPGPLLNHAAIHGALAYLASGAWRTWGLPLAIFLTHAGIDYLKARARRTQAVFWADQAAHLLVLGVVTTAAGMANIPGTWPGLHSSLWTQLCVLLVGAIVCIRVLAIVIGFWVEPYLAEIKAAGQDGLAAGAARGLTNGGRTIGQWERALIFLLVLAGQPAGVGFLIAAKSIFRFGELMDRKNRMEAEYITVGTLMSFGTALAVAFGTLLLLKAAS